MGALSEWIRQVVMVLILTGLVELALPTGAMRRYVQVVLGLLVLLAVIRPVLAWLGSEPADLVPAWQRALAAVEGEGGLAGGTGAGPVDRADLEAARDRTRSLALDLHRQRLIALVREEVRATVGVEPLAIDLDLVTDPASPRWGAVLGLTLHLPAAPGAGTGPALPPAGDAGGSGIQPVEPVRIGPITSDVGTAGSGEAGAGGLPPPGPEKGTGAAGPAGSTGGGPAAGTPAAGARGAWDPAQRQALSRQLQQVLASRLDLNPAAIQVIWVEAVEGGDGGGTR
ncbi:stage III sporulation protein AF [Thermaerobacter litoralis]